MKNLFFLVLFFLSSNLTYGEVIKFNCIIKYQGFKDDEWNFTFITPPDSRTAIVLLNEKSMEYKENLNSSEIKNLVIEKSIISLTNILTEKYDPPRIYQGILYESSEINWIFDISRATGKFTLTEFRNGLQKAVNPHGSTATGQCQNKSKNF